MSIRYDSARGSFVDGKRYVPPATVAEKLAAAEATIEGLEAKLTHAEETVHLRQDQAAKLAAAEEDKERLFNEVQACRKLLAAAEERVREQHAAHVVEVTGLLRSFMGYLAALTASSSDMVTFVAQKLNPYQDELDARLTTEPEAKA